MKNELTVTNNTMNRTLGMVTKAKESFETINALLKTGNPTALALVNEQRLNHQYQVGYILGSLKANLDCLPEDIAARQKMNGIPLNLLIKMKVDEFCLDVRETAHPEEMTLYTGYEEKYRRLSELICGFGYNMSFIEDRFERFFPKGTHMFVLGFAVGNSETFHEIAAQAAVSTDYTDPKTQDIWKNWMYFLKRDVHEYRLDGAYLFMYHGGWNPTSDKSIPYGNNCRKVNMNVYDLLRARSEASFTEEPFDVEF